MPEHKWLTEKDIERIRQWDEGDHDRLDEIYADIRRLLIDRQKAWELLMGLYRVALWLAAQEGRKLTEHEAHEIGSYLNGLAWLADSPGGESHALADGKLHDGISTTGQFDD